MWLCMLPPPAISRAQIDHSSVGGPDTLAVGMRPPALPSEAVVHGFALGPLMPQAATMKAGFVASLLLACIVAAAAAGEMLLVGWARAAWRRGSMAAARSLVSFW